MFRLIIHGLLVTSVAMTPVLTTADEGRKLPTIGFAVPVDPATDAPFQEAFRSGLRDLGWIDGKNLTIVVRYANGDPAKLRSLVKELVALPVDILVGDAKVALEATTTIPIVSETMDDPVRAGLVPSLARPGGNLTGVSAQTYDLWPKRVELARELVPSLKHLCFLFDTTHERGALAYANGEFKEIARGAGITVRTLPIASLDDLRGALETIPKECRQVLMIWRSPFIAQHRRTIMNAVALRIPVIGDAQSLAEDGALLSYSVDWLDMFRRSATYVDKILKGAKPGDLPIEQPTKFNLVANVRTANGLGIRIPQSILVRADTVIR
jgi:putative ABC transport system substrate-binding protein